MNEEKIYRGKIRTGRGGAVGEMSKPGGLEGFQILTGLSIIPGTLNIKLSEPFDISLLNYLKFADVGWEFDPATQGISYDGEIGTYYRRTTVADEYPACLVIFTWVTDINTDAELVSPHHLRTKINMQDGDNIEFTLDSNRA